MERHANQEGQEVVTCGANYPCPIRCYSVYLARIFFFGVIVILSLLISGAITTVDGYDSSFYDIHGTANSTERVVGPLLLAFSMALFLASFMTCVVYRCSKRSTTSTGTDGGSQRSNTFTETYGAVVTTTTTTTDGQYQPVVTGPGTQPNPQQGYQYPAAAAQYPGYQSTAAYPPQGGPAYTPQATYPPQGGATCQPLQGEATHLPQKGTTYRPQSGATFQPQGGATYHQGGAYPPQGGATYPPQGSPAAPPVGQYDYNEPPQFLTAASVPYQPQAAGMPTAPPIANTDLPPAYDELEENNAVL